MTSLKLFTQHGRSVLAILAILALWTLTPSFATAQRGATDSRIRTQKVDRNSDRPKKVSKKSGSRAKKTKSTRSPARSSGRTARNTSRATSRNTSRATSRSTAANTPRGNSSASRKTHSAGAKIRTTQTSGTARTNTRPPAQSRSRSQTRSKVTRTKHTSNTSSDARVNNSRSDTRVNNRRSNARASNRRSNARAQKNTVYVPAKRSRYSDYGRDRRHYRYDYHSSSRRHYSHNYYPYRHWYLSPRIFWPNIHVHIGWPWQLRYDRYWAPRYRYRQVVVIRKDWNRNVSTSRVELETQYSHRVIHADEHSAELEIRIESINTYIEGQFYGSIISIPEEFSTVHARVSADGRVEFDRELFVLGDSRSGFELVSTRYYDGRVADEYRESDGYLAARLDFDRGEARRIGRSRLFRPQDARAFVPVSLLPEDQGWLWDSGPESVSAYNDNYDYYYGSGSRNSSLSGQNATFSQKPVSAEYQNAYTAQSGAGISFTKKTELQRVE